MPDSSSCPRIRPPPCHSSVPRLVCRRLRACNRVAPPCRCCRFHRSSQAGNRFRTPATHRSCRPPCCSSGPCLQSRRSGAGTSALPRRYCSRNPIRGDSHPRSQACRRSRSRSSHSSDLLRTSGRSPACSRAAPLCRRCPFHMSTRPSRRRPDREAFRRRSHRLFRNSPHPERCRSSGNRWSWCRRCPCIACRPDSHHNAPPVHKHSKNLRSARWLPCRS